MTHQAEFEPLHVIRFIFYFFQMFFTSSAPRFLRTQGGQPWAAATALFQGILEQDETNDARVAPARSPPHCEAGLVDGRVHWLRSPSFSPHGVTKVKTWMDTDVRVVSQCHHHLCPKMFRVLLCFMNTFLYLFCNDLT